MSRINAIIKAAKNLYKKAPAFADDWGQSVFGKSNNVANKSIGRVKPNLAEDVASSPENQEIFARIRKALDPIFGETVYKDIPYRSRNVAGIKSNVTVFSDTYYKARQLISQGKLHIDDVGAYARKENLKLIKDAVHNTALQKISHKYYEMDKTLGISRATSKEVTRYLRQAEQALAMGDNRAYNRAMKGIKEQLRGQMKADIQSGKKGAIASLDKLFYKEHELTQKHIRDIFETQNLSKLGKGIKPIIKQQKGNQFNQDMFHNDTLGVIDYILAVGKRNNIPFHKLKAQIDAELKAITLKQIKNNRKFKGWSIDEIDKFYKRFGFQPSVGIDKQGNMIIKNVIMSSDYTAGYAPVFTYVDKGYKNVHRMMHDIYDGGTIGKFDFSKGFNFNYNLSVAQNRLWNLDAKKLLVETSGLRKLNQIDSPVLSLKYSKLWRKIQSRSQFKQTVDRISRQLNVPKEVVEDELLLRINRYVELDTSSGAKGAMRSLDDLMDKFLYSGTKSNKQLDLNITNLLADRKVAKSLLGDAGDSALLKQAREAKIAKDLLKGKKPKTDVQLKKLPPDVQKIVNLIQEGEARGFTGEELRKFVFNRAAKLGIGGSVLAGIFADDD